MPAKTSAACEYVRNLPVNNLNHTRGTYALSLRFLFTESTIIQPISVANQQFLPICWMEQSLYNTSDNSTSCFEVDNNRHLMPKSFVTLNYKKKGIIKINWSDIFVGIKIIKQTQFPFITIKLRDKWTKLFPGWRKPITRIIIVSWHTFLRSSNYVTRSFKNYVLWIIEENLRN